LSRGQHRGEISLQFDSELVAGRDEDDGVHEAPKRLRGFRTAFCIREGERQRCDLLAVESGKVGMQQRHQSACGSELCKQRFLARLQLVHLGPEFRPGEAVFDRVITFRIPARTRSSSRSADFRLARYSIGADSSRA
jgi:hypothetical protein